MQRYFNYSIKRRCNSSFKKARAAGILVIALDTPIADPEAQDMTFATDNFEAGLLIGKWAKAKWVMLLKMQNWYARH